MSIFSSTWRFIITLGGLLSSKVDETTDALTTTPAGIKAAFSQTRKQWERQYHEVRDAVAQLMMVMEQKRAEIKKLEAEQADLELKKKGSVEKFRQTREEKFQVMFNEFHARITENDMRLQTLNTEVGDLEKQLDRYKIRLTQMQSEIKDLDRKEAEAIADIVSSKQIVDLNDRLQQMGTSLHDENLKAIEKSRQRLKAKAKLSDELAGTDRTQLEMEVKAAGMSTDAMDEFNKMLADSELKQSERPNAPQTERLM